MERVYLDVLVPSRVLLCKGRCDWLAQHRKSVGCDPEVVLEEGGHLCQGRRVETQRKVTRVQRNNMIWIAVPRLLTA